MKIEITKEEYVDLLDLLHIASWVLVSHKTAVDPRIEKYDFIIQRFYAIAAEAGRRDLVEYDPGRKKYHPTQAFENTSRALEYIDDFVDHSFWDELIIRFAERDAARQAGGYDKLEQLGHEDRHALEVPLEEHFTEEFNEHGIERLEIIEQFGGDALKRAVTHD